MTSDEFWMVTYTAVLSMRLHPRNDGDRCVRELVDDARLFALKAANGALEDIAAVFEEEAPSVT